MTRPDQVAGHRRAHRPESDHADPLHGQLLVRPRIAPGDDQGVVGTPKYAAILWARAGSSAWIAAIRCWSAWAVGSLISFSKIEKVLGYRAQVQVHQGISEIRDALEKGTLQGEDPTCYTLQWYKSLLKWEKRIQELSLHGSILHSDLGRVIPLTRPAAVASGHHLR